MPFSKEFLVNWRMIDANGHMGNTAYLDLAADVRWAFLVEHGFGPADFRRFQIGPVVQKDEIEYSREVHLHDTVTVTYELLAASADGSRFVIENQIFTATGDRAAVVRSTGGWLDLQARKLIVPPPELQAVFAKIPHAAGFKELSGKSQPRENT